MITKKIIKLLNLISFVCVLFFNTLNAQELQWGNTFGGAEEELIKSSLYASDGNLILLGSTYSTDGAISSNHGGKDIWLIKTDTNGTVIWEKTFGGSNNEYGNSIIQTNDGGFIISGITLSNDGDVGELSHTSDAWIIKTDSDGNIQWEKTYGGSNIEDANAIVQTDDGGYIFVARSYSLDGDVSNHHDLYYTSDYWVVKIDSNGNMEWEKSYGGNSQDVPYDIVKTSDGNFVIIGESNGNEVDASNPHGAYDIWMIKIDNDGTLIWEKSLGGTGSETGYKVMQTPTDELYAVGFTESNDLDVSNLIGERDFWVIKLDAEANIIWEKTFGGTSIDKPYDFKMTQNGNILIAGYSSSSDGDVSANYGGYDAWVIYIDPSGNLLWEKNYGGSEGDIIRSCSLSPNDEMFIAGYTNSSDGDIIENYGNTDVWVVRINNTLNVVENNTLSQLRVFPNPTNHTIHIQTVEKTEQLIIEIYSSQGQKILSTHKTDIDLSNLQTGVYWLKAQIGQKIATKKIIKQ